ncbi:hypothetical protein AGIG_G20093 [Arapaima gigas]
MVFNWLPEQFAILLPKYGSHFACFSCILWICLETLPGQRKRTLSKDVQNAEDRVSNLGAVLLQRSHFSL